MWIHIIKNKCIDQFNVFICAVRRELKFRDFFGKDITYWSVGCALDNSIWILLLWLNDLCCFQDVLFGDEEYALPDPADRFDELLRRCRSKDHKKRALTRLTVNMSDSLNFSVGVWVQLVIAFWEAWHYLEWIFWILCKFYVNIARF